MEVKLFLMFFIAFAIMLLSAQSDAEECRFIDQRPVIDNSPEHSILESKIACESKCDNNMNCIWWQWRYDLQRCHNIEVKPSKALNEVFGITNCEKPGKVTKNAPSCKKLDMGFRTTRASKEEKLNSEEDCKNKCNGCLIWHYKKNTGGCQTWSLMEQECLVDEVNEIVQTGIHYCKQSIRCGIPNRISRMINGQATVRNEYPWQVSIWKNKKHECGGTIISKESILTAAHCVADIKEENYELITVQVGIHDASVASETSGRSIDSIIVHPDFFPAPVLANNIAIIMLKEPLSFYPETDNKNIAPVCLPPNIDDTDKWTKMYRFRGKKYEGIEGTLLGFMYRNDVGVLRSLKLKTMDNENCAGRQYGIEKQNEQYFPFNDQMCAYIDDASYPEKGDFGGPFITNANDGRYQLIGVLSEKIHSEKQEDSDKEWMTVLTRVVSHFGFITKYVKKTYTAEN